MKFIFRLVILTLLLGFVLSCRQGLQRSEPASSNSEFKQSEGLPASPVRDLTVQSSPQSAPIEEVQQVSSKIDGLQNRKLIYTANLRIEIKKYEESYSQVQALVKEWGGFIADLQVYENADQKKSATVLIRVPESHFQKAVDQLKTVGKLKSEQIHGQDITEEYTDLEARLKNKRELETRLLDILRTKTGKLSDLLEVERELARVREEIEQMEGRKRFLDDRVSLATITLNLYEPSALTSLSQWQPLRKAIESMTEIFAESLGVLLIFLAAVLPWLVLGLIFIFILVKMIKWRWAKWKVQKKNDVI